MQDLTLLGHVAFLRYYAVQVQALAYASPTIAAKLRQIAHSLEMDGDALEKIVSGEGLTEAWQEACVAPPATWPSRRTTPATGTSAVNATATRLFPTASMRSSRVSTRRFTGRARNRIDGQNFGGRGERVGSTSAGSPTTAKLSAPGSNNFCATARASSSVTPPIRDARRSR